MSGKKIKLKIKIKKGPQPIPVTCSQPIITDCRGQPNDYSTYLPDQTPVRESPNDLQLSSTLQLKKMYLYGQNYLVEVNSGYIYPETDYDLYQPLGRLGQYTQVETVSCGSDGDRYYHRCPRVDRSVQWYGYYQLDRNF